MPLWEAASPFFACFFRCHQTRPVHYREQVNYAAMPDARQRMVSIRLRAYLMLITPLSRLIPRRSVEEHNIVLCLKAGLAGEDGPWGLNGELGNARFSRLAQSRSITDRPTTA